MELFLGFLLGAATVFIGTVWYLKREKTGAKAKERLVKNMHSSFKRFGNN